MSKRQTKQVKSNKSENVENVENVEIVESLDISRLKKAELLELIGQLQTENKEQIAQIADLQRDLTVRTARNSRVSTFKKSDNFPKILLFIQQIMLSDELQIRNSFARLDKFEHAHAKNCGMSYSNWFHCSTDLRFDYKSLGTHFFSVGIEIVARSPKNGDKNITFSVMTRSEIVERLENWLFAQKNGIKKQSHIDTIMARYDEIFVNDENVDSLEKDGKPVDFRQWQILINEYMQSDKQLMTLFNNTVDTQYLADKQAKFDADQSKK